MSDRPILFSGPMVRAILEGRKTQTRRIVTPQPVVPFSLLGDIIRDEPGVITDSRGVVTDAGEERIIPVRFSVRDRLWVREAWSGPYAMGDIPPRDWMPGLPVWYWADGNPEYGDWTIPKSSIHMPRWASRLTLIVTDVRVQRLQEIGEEDARAEGLYSTICRSPDTRSSCRAGWWQADENCGGPTPRDAFAALWRSINGPDSWDANPWVVAVSFDLRCCNIDSLDGITHDGRPGC